MTAYSYNFLLHIIAFAFSSVTLITLFILHRKLCAEQDWEKKLYIAGIMRLFVVFGPYVIAALLLTGFGNMVNRYGLYSPWPHEMWLAIKITLFVIMAFNALYIGPRINIKRAALIKSVIEKKGPDNAEALLAKQNRSISIFLYVQTALLLSIVILSVFGSGKHPGIF